MLQLAVGAPGRDRTPEATEQNTDLARQLWKARAPVCGQANAPTEPLARLMTQWSR